jgi:hypothetical protein
MNIQALIDKGNELRTTAYDSPTIDMWQNDLKATVAEYGDETLKVLDIAMWIGQIPMSDQHAQQMHNEMIDKVCVLLEELKSRESADTRRQSDIINQKRREAKASINSKFNRATINVNGPATFGDNSPANNIQVGELMLAIIAQAEDNLPDGKEKESILEKLRAVVANPTFAALAGASLPEILKRLMNQP